MLIIQNESGFMRKLFYSYLFFCILYPELHAQTLLWTEKDRNFLLENLQRTSNEVKKETEALTLEQWHFKENDSSWSIAQVVEHLGLYERTFNHERTVILQSKPEPELLLLTKSDNHYLAWMNEPQPHIANKIHTPLGLMKGKDNLIFFLYGRNLLIDFISSTSTDLKSYFTYRGGDEKRRSLHALFVIHFGHTDRHLKQIRRIKQHQNFQK